MKERLAELERLAARVARAEVEGRLHLHCHICHLEHVGPNHKRSRLVPHSHVVVDVLDDGQVPTQLGQLEDGQRCDRAGGDIRAGRAGRFYEGQNLVSITNTLDSCCF